MAVLLWGLLLALAMILMTVLAVLATPVKLELFMRSSPRWRSRITVRLLGGLTPAIPVHDSDRARQMSQSPKPSKKQRRTEQSRLPASTLRRALTATPDLLKGLLWPISVDRLTVNAEFGLGDPADTGQVFGLLAPFIYSGHRRDVVSINLNPDFTALRLSGEAFGRLSLVPIAFIPPAIRFAWRAFRERP